MINTLQSMMAENEGKVNKERDRKNKKRWPRKYIDLIKLKNSSGFICWGINIAYISAIACGMCTHSPRKTGI